MLCIINNGLSIGFTSSQFRYGTGDMTILYPGTIQQASGRRAPLRGLPPSAALATGFIFFYPHNQRKWVFRSDGFSYLYFTGATRKGEVGVGYHSSQHSSGKLVFCKQVITPVAEICCVGVKRDVQNHDAPHVL